MDPPYVLGTRVLQGSGRGYYRHEMTDDDHAELLAKLCELEGMVIVTGYETNLYHDALRGWRVEKTDARISAGRGTAIRTEVLWMNPACSDALESAHGGLFSTANAKSQATDAALSRQVACTDGLGVAVPSAPTFEKD